ncbi:hypothetical protein [Chryseobacterium sp. NKUCC03_KSP]|uniref:hypothetical protein n=1 Tax=Chryseobacterium sp. NKUCC03_KSP TaxID=2842125 RepID=UPI001C5B1BC9|nr:hypothetical protein [Chryseobacterium sp. NKUCC03_KSP]MBW3521609.1 hypothetical protein [Chryseobacterium sp. NKUCC03_KSP]
MKKYIVLGALSVLAMSCNKKNEKIKPVVTTDSLENPAEPVVDTLGARTFCYLGVTGKDSVFVSLDDNLGTFSGKMAYKNSEKDSSKGELFGFRSGDTLKLTYEFASEGTTSKRDIYFIQKDNVLTEGIGDQKDENGTMRYADEKKITYKDGQKLETADCKVVTKALN